MLATIASIANRRPHWGTIKGLLVTLVAVPLLAGAFVGSGLAELLVELAQ